jgi:competence protein ComEC
MSTPARTGVLSAAAGLARAADYAPDWRKAFAVALAREVEERRFFLWLPVAAMGGVALNLAADREPVLWLPAGLIALFGGLAWVSRARPLALGLSLAFAALFAGFLAMSLRTGRVAAPVLDRIRIVSLQGYVEEVDLRPVGARMVIAVARADGMPREKIPSRVRVTTRKSPNVAAGDFVAMKARLLPPSHAALPGGYDFARDAFFAGVGAVGSTLGAIRVLPPPGDASWRQRFAAADRPRAQPTCPQGERNHRRRRGRDRRRHGHGQARLPLMMWKMPASRIRSLASLTISGVQMTLVAGIVFVVARRLLALSPTLALKYPIKKWAAVVAMAASLLYDVATGSRVGTERALVMTLIVLGAVVMDRRALTMRNLAFAVFAVIAIEPEAILGVSFQLSFAAVAALVAVMEARLTGIESDPDPYLPQRGKVLTGGFWRTSSASRSGSSLRPPARPAPPPRSWPIISTISVPADSSGRRNTIFVG